MCNWHAIAIKCHVIFNYINFVQKLFVHPVKKSTGTVRVIRFIYVMEVTGVSKLEDRWGVRTRKNASVRRRREERKREHCVVLKGTEFILRLRRSGTFDVTLCWWMVVKVVLLVNGGNGRLKRAFAVKIRSLRANKPTVSRSSRQYL